jgi:hypothetical protein
MPGQRGLGAGRRQPLQGLLDTGLAVAEPATASPVISPAMASTTSSSIRLKPR